MAWLKAWGNDLNLDLHYTDRTHPNAMGYYLNALVTYAARTDSNPGEQGVSLCGAATKEQAAILQRSPGCEVRAPAVSKVMAYLRGRFLLVRAGLVQRGVAAASSSPALSVLPTSVTYSIFNSSTKKWSDAPPGIVPAMPRSP
jgi:hypothetical protein